MRTILRLGMVRPSLQMLADDVQQRLKPDRFLHVLGVTHAAVQMAMRHGGDPELAAIAALLHDRSKSMSPAEIEADLGRRGIAIPDEDRSYPAVWHGVHAGAVARQDQLFGDAKDAEQVSEAVSVHSTADRALGDLAKILFVADFTEPGRDFEGIDDLRAAARKSLDEGFKRCLVEKCRYMKKRGQPVSPRAVRALEFYHLAL